MSIATGHGLTLISVAFMVVVTSINSSISDTLQLLTDILVDINDK
ncbi:hypothetical protein JMUB7507_26500 [Staphylococcus aureus]